MYIYLTRFLVTLTVLWFFYFGETGLLEQWWILDTILTSLVYYTCPGTMKAQSQSVVRENWVYPLMRLLFILLNPGNKKQTFSTCTEEGRSARWKSAFAGFVVSLY